MRQFLSGIASLAMAVQIQFATAQPATILRADPPVSGDQFGRSVAIDGHYAVVGVPADDTIASEAGAAYVYQRTSAGWISLQTLYGPDIGDQFGYSVAVVIDRSGLNEGDFIAVGSLLGDGATSFAGNVSIYRRVAPATTFTFQQTVSAGDGSGFDEFGHAVALDLSIPGESLSGDPVYTLVVGAPDDNGSQGSDMGAVYTFQLAPNGVSWAQTGKLVPTDTVGGDLLGRSVAIKGDLIIAGASGWPFGNNPEGVAYLIRRFFDTGAGYFNWEVNNRLSASDGESGDQFGRRVAIDIGVPIVGAPFANNGSGGQGAVYIFGGAPAGFEVSESQRIIAANPSASVNFGINLAIDNQVLVASEETAPPRIHVFQSQTANDWSWLETVSVTDPLASQVGSEALEFCAPFVVAGDPFHANGGAAYVLTSPAIFIFNSGFD